MEQATPVVAFRFSSTGQAAMIAVDEIARASTELEPGSFDWIHLARDAASTGNWLEASGVDQFVHDALVAEETRPRCTFHGEGAIVNLRGVNLNPGAEPDDMVSIRLWIEAHRIVSVWIRPLKAVADLRDSIERGHGPTSPGDFVAKLAIRLADRAEPTVSELAERVDALEEMMLESNAEVSRSEMAAVRRSAIVLRRFMIPQRDALRALEIEDLAWLYEKDRSKLREAVERIARFGEELDALRDRAQIIQDQVVDARAEAMNRNMMVLSAVAAIFLPLGLLTGLLGINVGGIPGSDNPSAFLIVTGLLLVLALGQIVLFRRFGILR